MMASNTVVKRFKVGVGKILMGNFIRMLKLHFPRFGKFAARYIGKNDASIAQIRNRYDNIERISSKNFLEQHLDSGDILLRHSPTIVGIGTQLVDNTWWDHISMIIVQRGKRPSSMPTPPVPPWAPDGFEWEPFHDGQMQLFEANQIGCYTYPLGQFLRLFKRKNQLLLARRLQGVDDHLLIQEHKTDQQNSSMSTKDIEKRRLYNAMKYISERSRLNDNQRDVLESYVREIQGRPYERNVLSELLSLIITHPPDLSIMKDKSDENLETIFCSELVAEGYQRMGLIPNCVLNSNEVMPSAFAKGQNVIDSLMLHESICDDDRKVLGNEKIITWDDIENNFKEEKWWF